MSRAPSFEQLSMRAAEQFLQTALLLDDQAFPKEEQESFPVELGQPQPFEIDEEDVDLSAAAISAATHSNNPIPTEDIIKGFADLAIVCAVLDPRDTSGKWTSLHPDITILDWYIGDETRARARQLVADLIRREQADHPHQVRLLLIYTTEQDLLDIREKLGELLKSFGGELPKEVGKTGLSWEGWRLVVLAKEDTPVAGDLVSLVVKYEDLPQRAVVEFSEIARGLLPHVALAGLAAIRRNTHRILSRLPSALDPAFLTHRALLPEPQDAEDHLVALLGSELTAVLEDERVGESANVDATRAWIGARQLKYPLEVNTGDDKLQFKNRRGLGNLFSSGVYHHKQVETLKADPQARLVKKLRDRLTGLLGGNPKTDDVAFAELSAFRPHYGAVAPRLTLGTVVSDAKEMKQWICVQPRCDSVRLKKQQPFVFMPLDECGEFDICLLREGDALVKLRRGRKPHMLKTYRFKPDEGGTVRARKRGGRYEFTTTGHVKLRFLGQLRDEIAQDVAQKLATQLTRVGVNQSEWQRLSLPRAIRDQ